MVSPLSSPIQKRQLNNRRQPLRVFSDGFPRAIPPSLSPQLRLANQKTPPAGSDRAGGKGATVLIGLCGYAGVGKDTAAEVLIEEFGYKRVAFADPIRDSVIALDPYISHQGEFHRLSDFMADQGGWEAAKDNEEVRRLSQAMGTEVGRNILSHDLWVLLAETRLDDRTVVTDTRFPNEARLIRKHGGILIRVERPGFGPVNAHLSDRASEKWTYEHRIQNDSNVESLHQKMRELVRTLIG